MTDPVSLMAGLVQELQSFGQAAGGVGATSFDSLSQGGAVSGGGVDFVDTLKQAMDRVDGAIATGESNSNRLASGDQSVSLSDVMVSLEKANLSFQAAATVRDRVVDAYQTIMNMQV